MITRPSLDGYMTRRRAVVVLPTAIRGADAGPKERKRTYRSFGRSEIERITAEQAALDERRPEVLVLESEALALEKTQALLRLLAAKKHRTREEEDALLLLLMSCAAMT